MLKLLPWLESGVGAAITPPDLFTRVISSVCQAGSLIEPVMVPVGSVAVALALVNVTVLKLATRPVPSSIHSAELRMGFELTIWVVNVWSDGRAGDPASSRDNW